MALLRPSNIRVADSPPSLFRYGLAQHDDDVRAFVPYIETLMPDECAWAALFTDEQRLDTFRSVYGNRPKRKPKRKPKPEPPALFGREVA